MMIELTPEMETNPIKVPPIRTLRKTRRFLCDYLYITSHLMFVRWPAQSCVDNSSNSIVTFLLLIDTKIYDLQPDLYTTAETRTSFWAPHRKSDQINETIVVPHLVQKLPSDDLLTMPDHMV
jgi:hypothetical protein